MLDRYKAEGADQVDQVDLLKVARNALNEWQTAARAVHCELSQVNLKLPDGSQVVFELQESGAWRINTSG